MRSPRLAPVLAVLLAAPALAAAGDPARDQKQREYFTNSVLLDQQGREVRFFDDVVKDRVVLMQFIFTRCTSACPLLVQKLVQTRAALGGAIPEGVRFVSLSVDPGHDGPAQLRAFAEKQGAAVAGWSFLTGEKASVDLVTRRLGQYVDAPEDHSTVVIAGNARTNHWLRVRPDAPPALIARQVRELLAERAPASPAGAQAAAK